MVWGKIHFRLDLYKMRIVRKATNVLLFKYFQNGQNFYGFNNFRKSKEQKQTNENKTNQQK